VNECLWCDAPTDEKLCPTCRAAHDHPLHYCAVNPKHLPTHGDECAECQWNAAAKARAQAINAPIIASLKRIRAQHIAEWAKPWPGLEFGKAHFGMMLDSAIKRLEGES